MRQYIGFKLVRTTYALPISKVREIINIPLVTVWPNAPDHVTGIINLRGTVISIIDGGKLLRVPAARPDDGKVIIVISGERLLGLAVDSITGVIRIDPKDEEPAPIVDNRVFNHVQAVAKHSIGLVMILSPETLCPGRKYSTDIADQSARKHETNVEFFAGAERAL